MKKVLKLKLEPEVHDKFRTWAFNHRVTMQGELENYVGGLVDGSPKTPAVPRKQPSKAPEVISGGLVGVEPPKPIPAVPKPTPEEVESRQRLCKHAFVPGSRQCVKCGWVPPILS